MSSTQEEVFATCGQFIREEFDEDEIYSYVEMCMEVGEWLP